MSNNEHNDKRLLDNINASLEQASQGLDQQTLRALQKSRHAALAQLHKPRHHWQAVSGFAVAASVALLVFALFTFQANDSDIMHHAEDISLLSSGDDFELYENLEFYQWLAFEERTS